MTRKSDLWIKFLITADGNQNAKDSWQVRDLFHILCVTGTVGCTHVRIEKPAGPQGDEFLNRKGQASIKVQAICSIQEFKLGISCPSWRKLNKHCKLSAFPSP